MTLYLFKVWHIIHLTGLTEASMMAEITETGQSAFLKNFVFEGLTKNNLFGSIKHA